VERRLPYQVIRPDDHNALVDVATDIRDRLRARGYEPVEYESALAKLRRVQHGNFVLHTDVNDQRSALAALRDFYVAEGWPSKDVDELTERIATIPTVSAGELVLASHRNALIDAWEKAHQMVVVIISPWIMHGANPMRTGVQEGVGEIPSYNLLWRYEVGDDVWAEPVIGDIDGDGEKEVIAGSSDNYVYCLRAKDGTLKWRYQTGHDVGNVAIKDVDGDGKMEVFFGSRDDYFYCLNSDGTLKWKKGPYANFGNPNSGGPYVGDVDGDGEDEVIVTYYPDATVCFKAKDGTEKWKDTTRGNVDGCVAVADIDEDGEKEILVGRFSLPKYVYCLRPDGTEKWKTATTCCSGLSLEDIDGDGKLEIIGVEDAGEDVACLEHDGTIKWTYTAPDFIYHYRGPPIADIDKDGKKEIVVGYSGGVICLTNDGKKKWENTDLGSTGYIQSCACLGDFDNDGKMEVATGNEDGIIGIADSDGTTIWYEALLAGCYPGWDGISSEDVNGDGLVELLVGGVFPAHEIACLNRS